MSYEILELKSRINKLMLEEPHEINIQLLSNLLQMLDEKTLTYSILKSTKIGITINKLRKHKSETIRNKSAHLFSKMKKLFVQEKRKNSTNKSGDLNKKSKTQTKTNTNTNTINKTPNNNNVNNDLKATNLKNNKKTTTIKKPLEKKTEWVLSKTSKNKVRDNIWKTFSLDLYHHFHKVENPQIEIEELARQIETALLKKTITLGKNYKRIFRKIAHNLATEEHDELRQNLFSKIISPEKLVNMSNSDFMTKEQKHEHKKFLEEGVKKSQGRVIQTKTNRFKCFRCKSYECSYAEYQSRSGDEPMTVLVTCLICNNAWKL
ncbi:transcription elongation factor tfiis [Anaeramoeba flamelloides]|uniref:Transcription elongation factor tfiis n=1 Tax=Anaeramoeba flamelloides TaxID=1746091 RepID=A0AAV7ZHV9_9EUKA|nr:transcription elongation factor tfiis [Anaeramoeba flamelloides]